MMSKVQFEGETVSGTSAVVFVKFRANTYAIATELRLLNPISDGGCRHLDFTSGINFGHCGQNRFIRASRVKIGSV